MSKSVAIMEGENSRQFNKVKYLRTDLTAGGQCEWVPQDERKLKTKSVTKNGTYKIKDESGDYYGFSQFTVNVKGSTTGRKNPATGGDGNSYTIDTDEQGNLTETVLPDSIMIVTSPNKTSYVSGESIDLTGAVVKAYKHDGTLWEGDGYSGGVIPLSELSIDPTTAQAGGTSGNEYTDGDGLNVIKIYTGDETYDMGGWGTFRASGYNLGTRTSGQYVGCSTHFGHKDEIPPFFMYVTKYWATRPITGQRMLRVVYFPIVSTMQTDSVAIAQCYPEYPLYAYNATVYKYNPRWEGDYYEDIANDAVNVPLSTKDPTGITDLSGLTGNGADIKVMWNRPSDGKELETSFAITVSSSDNNTGGGGGSW